MKISCTELPPNSQISNCFASQLLPFLSSPWWSCILSMMREIIKQLDVRIKSALTNTRSKETCRLKMHWLICIEVKNTKNSRGRKKDGCEQKNSFWIIGKRCRQITKAWTAWSKQTRIATTWRENSRKLIAISIELETSYQELPPLPLTWQLTRCLFKYQILNSMKPLRSQTIDNLWGHQLQPIEQARICPWKGKLQTSMELKVIIRDVLHKLIEDDLLLIEINI